jgi:uncharacterized membrane protein YqiK
MILGILFLIAIAVMAIPLALAIGTSVAIGLAATLVLETVGVIVLLATAYLAAYRKFYVIAEANQAIIRTGGLGKATDPDVAIGQGIWVIPMIHKMQILRFEQHVLTVSRRETQALLCADCLLADVSITFKVTVPQTKDDVLRYLAAAGTKPLNEKSTIEILVNDSLETALRDAATSKTYQELFDGREEVGKAIEDSLSNDLPKTGLQMTSAKLTDVQATDQSHYDPNNPQHAVGLTKIVEITQDQSLKTTRKQLETSKAIRSEQVITQKEILDLNRDQAFAESAQTKQISVQQAIDKRTAQESAIEQAEAVQKRQIEMDKNISVQQASQEQVTQQALVEKQKAVEAAEIAKTVAIQTAKKDQEIELVEKERQKRIAEEAQAIDVANKMAERAAAEATRQEAEAQAEKARQAVETVKTVETASREKQKAIIGQESASEQAMIAKQKSADADAYAVKKEAEARQLAADADYAAKVKAAEALRKSIEAEAAGTLAQAMIPVDVKRKEVEVDGERVAVLERELAAKTKHGEAALKFELDKFTVEQEAKVRIETAHAIAQLTSNVKANIYGDASTLEAVTSGIAKSFGLASFLNGLDAGISPEVKGVIASNVGGIVNAIKGLGAKPTTEEIEDTVNRLIGGNALVDVAPKSIKKTTV